MPLPPSVSEPLAYAISRRGFIFLNLGAGAALFLDKARGMSPRDRFTHSFRLVRDDDLLQLDICFYRWERTGNQLRPLGTGDSLIAIRFPPQNLAEAIFDEKHTFQEHFENDPLPPVGGAANKNDATPPVKSYLSGPSWLVFKALSPESMDLDVDLWLRLAGRLDLNVAQGATGKWSPRPPAADETRLEIPFRLYISPEPDTSMAATQWEISTRVPTSPFREMWHASLRSRRSLTPAPPPEGMEADKVPEDLKPPRSSAVRARALWSPDYMKVDEPPFARYYPGTKPLSLHALTRHRLVKQMAAGDGWIDAEHLILTAIGADADLHYNSQKTVQTIIREQIEADKANDRAKAPGTELRMWKHRIIIGHDVFFVEAFFGVLLPLNFPSVYVEVTKRKFVSVGPLTDLDPKAHPPGAFLLKRRFILVTGDQQHFASSDSSIGRSMPQKNVRLKMLRSPDLADPADQMPPVAPNGYHDPNGGTEGIFFFPKDVNTREEVHWPMEMFDESGKSAEPSRAHLFFASNVPKGHRIYRDPNQISENQRTFLFPSPKVSLAPENSQLVVPIPPRAAGVDKVIQLPDELRLAAEKLGEELEKRLAGLRENPVTDEVASIATKFEAFVNDSKKATIATVEKELKKLVESMPDPAGEAEKMVDQVAKHALDVLKQAEKWYKNLPSDIGDRKKMFMTAWGDVITQLGRAKALSASVETKAIRFASGFVMDEIAAGKKLLEEFAKASDAQLEAKVGEIIDELEKNLGPWKEVEKNVTKRLATHLSNIRDATTQAKELAPMLRHKLARFANDLSSAKEELEKAGSQYFHPIVEQVEAVIPAVKKIVPDIQSSAVTIFEDYVAGGIQSVRNGTFAELAEVVGQAHNVGQQIQTGIAQPAAVIAGISREAGAVVAEGKEKLREYAREAEDLTKSIKETIQSYGKDIAGAIPNCKILGVLDIRKLVGLLARGQMPDLNVIEYPDKWEHVYEWIVQINDHDFEILKFNVEHEDGAPFTLRIYSKTTVHLPPPAELAKGARPWTEATVEGFLGNWITKEKKPFDSERKEKDHVSFALNLLNLIEARFRQVTFKASHTGQGSPKTEVNPELIGVEFLGPMKFVKDIQEMLGMRGFTIKLTPAYIFVGYEIDLPPLTTGVFCLRGVRLMSSLSMPFRNDPMRYRFGFASFAKPFELSVMGFAGRGFLEVDIASDGGRLLKGALEFGGALSFDIGIASGGLYVMAGAYFKIENKATDLSGYLRAGGYLNVLCLINASVEFMLSMNHRSVENSLWGICTVTVSIDMGLWDWDVDLSMEKQLQGAEEKKPAPNPAALTAGNSQTSRILGDGSSRPPTTPPKKAAKVIPYFGRGNVRGHFNGSSPTNASERWRDQYFNHFDSTFVS